MAQICSIIVDADYALTYPLIVDALNPLGLAHLHITGAVSLQGWPPGQR